MSNEMVNNEMVNEINDDEPLASLPKKKRTIFFLILYALFVIDFIARVGINAIFPIIQGDLQLSDGQMGSLASIVLLAMAVFVFPVAFLGEKYSTKKVISISAFVWGIGSFFSGIANSFMLLFVSRFMVGIGNSAYAPLSTSMVTSMYKKSDWGKKIGIYNTAIGLGTAAGALVFANIAN
ncbi:MAG TPA: MFS transporter, partial [Desulfitobacterium dehalogenans]|nr:MFS transporter [Desulfitobacterium dehalogenans]